LRSLDGGDSFRPSFQIPDDADERVAGALLDEALRVETHDRPAHRVSLVAADAEGEAALRVLTDLDDDDRVGFIAGVCPRESEAEVVVPAIVLNDVAHARRVRADVHPLKDALTVEAIFNRLVDEHRVSHGKLELFFGRSGLFDAPRHEDGRPGDFRAASEGEADVFRPLLYLLAKRWVGLVCELEPGVLLRRG